MSFGNTSPSLLEAPPNPILIARDLYEPPRPEIVSLGEACRDLESLGAYVRWWPTQLGLLDDLGTGGVTLEVWALGRQAGKTSMAAAAAVHNAAMRPDLDTVLPRGRIRYILVAGAAQSQSREFIRVCVGMLEQIPALDGMWEAFADEIRFSLPGGRKSTIRAVTTSSRSVRGVSASLLILDEFAHLVQTAGAGADVALYTALTPSLRRFGKLALTLVISTPAGRSGKFFELFEQAADGILENARAVQGTVYEMDPTVDREWLESQRQELGSLLFAQEYEASFNESGGLFFDLSRINLEQDSPAYPEEALFWVGALDPAFHADSFGYALIGLSRNEPGRWLLGPTGALAPEGEARSFDARRGREDDTLAAIHKILSPYQPQRLITDQHQAAPIESYFGQRGIRVESVNITGPIRTAAFVQARARLQDGSLRAWRQPQLIDELRRVRAGEGDKIVLPRHGDSHCDIAMALALGVWSMEQGGGAPAGAPARRVRMSASQYSSSAFG